MKHQTRQMVVNINAKSANKKQRPSPKRSNATTRNRQTTTTLKSVFQRQQGQHVYQ